MFAKRIALSSLSLFAALSACALAARAVQAQQLDGRYLYAALPGVGGGSSTTFGGVGILVFDIDNGHKFVKRIPLQGAAPSVGRGNGTESIRGIAAHAETARLYISTSRRLVAYDLITEKLVWEQAYENRGIDRVAITPDGKTLYAPGLGAPKWHVVDAATGALITSIDKVGSAHNTFISDDGRFAYLESQGRTRMMTVADARTHSLVREIGPFSDIVRPFTINGKQTLVFANLNNLLGFEVAEINTGRVLHRVEVPGVVPGRSPTHGIPSHGIAMTQDETEIWVTDNANNYLRVFDATVMPPTMKSSVKVRGEPGWITWSIDGKLAYPSTGDVIDILTKRIITTLQDENGQDVQSEKMLEIDFAGGKPVLAGDQFGVGKVR
jgi:DNA-binding beta-propeller fold protein YncE